MKPKVIVTRRWPTAVEQQLQKQYDVELNTADKPFSQQQFQDALKSCDALLTTVTDRVDSGVFGNIHSSEIKTRVIGNYGVGFSHIDIEAAKTNIIVVTNTPDVLSACTADIAMMLILMVARRAGEGERELRNGEWTGWRPTHLIGTKVAGSTLGIVGFGRIGRETAKRALGFGMEILVHNRSKIDAAVLSEFNATQVESIDQLVSDSDFVSLHCPGGDENKNLIDSRLLGLMKPNAFLINTARGEVIDEVALIDHLKSGSIGGAGLDVFLNEPAINEAFTQCPNTVLLPHLGSATEATRDAMGFRVLENLELFFNNDEPRDRVV